MTTYKQYFLDYLQDQETSNITWFIIPWDKRKEWQKFCVFRKNTKYIPEFAKKLSADVCCYPFYLKVSSS